ncbi:MAG: 2OG-Fe(II) oxygenase family protein [Pirellulaceae bacterium]|nr:2OG-Fe(II) oxygenase family protein [Pirellulaceae bacterium]
MQSLLRQNAAVRITSFPYNYVVIENAFDDHVAWGLSALVNDRIQQGREIGKVGEVGALVYEAINFTPTIKDALTTPLAAIASVELKRFIAGIFNIELDENLMIGMHRHEPPSKAGWAHTDYAIVSFPNIPPNVFGQRMYFDGCGCNYSDDSRDRQPNTIKTTRAIACLYYIANEEWQPGMGGETGVYRPDGKTLSTTIPPKNNSLFVFEISPISYHAYLGSATMRRSSIIWWYHAEPVYMHRRHADAVGFRTSQKMDPWDRWTDGNVAKYAVEK